MASTAGGQFTSFGDLVSMNDSGTVAFVGNNGTESGLWVDYPIKGLVNVNPGFTTKQPSDAPRSFGRAVAINDNGTLIATDRVSGSPALYLHPAVVLGQPRLPCRPVPAPGGFGDFSSLQTFTDINDNGDAAFVGLESDGNSPRRRV